MACAALGEFSYHTNVKTPRWIGYWFQRPEMSRIDHQHNWHKNNYADIVWWDMLFGTNENPEDFTASCRFDDKKEQQRLMVLAYTDVHSPQSRREATRFSQLTTPFTYFPLSSERLVSKL